MEELIKRLERVIATGVPDKDGMHPISAETVLEVVKELSELGTNLAEVGTKIEPQYKTDYGFMWLCPKCGLPIHSDYTRCVRCGHNREKGV